MPIEEYETILARIRSLAKKYSGKPDIKDTDFINRDIGINGRDFIDMIDELECIFNVSLEEISPLNPFDNARDASIKEISKIIMTNRTE